MSKFMTEKYKILYVELNVPHEIEGLYCFNEGECLQDYYMTMRLP